MPQQMRHRRPGKAASGSRRAGAATARSAPATSFVPAVLKSVALVRRLNERGADGAALGELASELKITRSHCHAILVTLVHCGWAIYDPLARRYRLNWQIAADSSSALRAQDTFTQIYPLVAALAQRVRLPCLISQPMPDGSFIVLRQIDGPNPLEVSIKRGERFPRDAPAQMKAALAWAGRSRFEQWLRDWTPVAYTPTTITTAQRLADELALTRKRGYALSLGEFNAGVNSVALPVFDADSNVLIVLQCPGFAAEVAARTAEIGREMQATVARIHALIGGRPPPGFPVPADGLAELA
jgi:DNA-binding IclR family transcriptional regulator